MILKWRKIMIGKVGISSFSCCWGFYVTSKQGIVLAELVLKGFLNIVWESLSLYEWRCSIDSKHLSKTSQVLSFLYREVTERCYGLQMWWNHAKNRRPWNRMWNIQDMILTLFLTCMMLSIGKLIYRNALQLLFMVASGINLVHGFCKLKSLFRCSKE